MQSVVARQITKGEAEVLEAAVQRAAVGKLPDGFALQSALSTAKVRSICSCGCDSIGFIPAGEKNPAEGRLSADAMAYRNGSSGEWVGIHVYASTDGELIEMELHMPYDGPALLPAAELVHRGNRTLDINSLGATSITFTRATLLGTAILFRRNVVVQTMRNKSLRSVFENERAGYGLLNRAAAQPIYRDFLTRQRRRINP